MSLPRKEKISEVEIMKVKEVFDDMKKVLDSFGIDEYNKKYNENGYELVITIRKLENE